MCSVDMLNPVILPVPESKKQVKGREKVLFLSAYAREALHQSAALSQVSLGDLKKDEDGVPIPSRGTYWSITHKTQYVGGVVAPAPIGIDIERIRDISEGLFRKTAADQEWALAGSTEKSLLIFFRFWTSKEAVLKATGIGIKDLLKCQVRKILDDCHLIIQYESKDWLIEHFFYDQHIASIVQNDFRIDWTVEKQNDIG